MLKVYCCLIYDEFLKIIFRVMSPVSNLIRSFRLARKLSQKEAMILLGVEQSYLSGLETGRIDFPKEGIKEKLINKYQLTSVEVDQLEKAIRVSKRRFSLPIDASEEVFEISNELFNQIDKLSTVQVNFLKLTLQINHQ